MNMTIMCPSRFNGKLDKLTFKLGPTKLSALDHKAIREKLAMAHD